MRKPFYRSAKKSWWIKNAEGKMIRLGKTRDEAIAAWHKMEATGESTADSPKSIGPTVATVVAEFLDWTKARRSAGTYNWYAFYLAGNKERPNHALGQFFGSRPVSDLKPTDLERWVDREYGDASENGRLSVKRAVMRAFNWAVKKRLIKENPVTGAEISAKVGSSREAAYQPRRTYLTPEQWETLIAKIPTADSFHDYLSFLRETGCRPHEGRILEARHFVRELGMLVIPKDEAKGKRERVIPLNTAALAIVQRLALKYPTGPLFRSNRGNPLTKNTVHGRLHKLGKKLGFKVHAYVLRRSFITDALVNGVHADALKTVVGHSTTAMIDTVYADLEKRAEFLRQVARQATGEVA